MKNKKQIIGKFGEDLALKYLEEKGYVLIKRNEQTSYTELDLILKYKNLFIFVEVKTRANERYGLAVDALGSLKQKNFKRSVMFFCRKNRIDFNYIRADFVAIQLDKRKKTAKINHFKDIV